MTKQCNHKRHKIICDDCKCEFEINYKYWKETNNKFPNKIWRCSNCNSKYKSELNKNRWKSLTIEELKDISDKQSKAQQLFWSKFSKDEKKKRAAIFINAGKNYWNNISDEELAAVSMRQINWWKALSEEEKEAYREKKRQWWKNLSEDKKQEYAKKQSDWYNNLPYAKKRIIIESLKNHRAKWLSSLSKDEREKYFKKNGKSLSRYWQNIDDDKKLDWYFKTNKAQSESNNVPIPKSELELINVFNINKFKYSCQYMNTSYPENFKELFGDRSPFHKWDFILYLKNKNILIDIDGSEHAVLPGSFVTSEGIDVGLLIQINDSKRPYQTDGLDAYVGKCYDDKLTDLTPVVNIKTQEKMNMKQLMALIEFYDNH